MSPDASPSIRMAHPEDAGAVAALAAQTFSDAFGAENHPDDLERHLAEHCSPAALGRQLTADGWSTLVGEADGRLLAFAQLCDQPPPLALRGGRPRQLYRLYVDRPCWGTGLAQRLMAAAMDEARGRGADRLWLTTWERNARGLAFYRKCGFREVGTTIFTVGRDPQHDLVLLLPLG